MAIVTLKLHARVILPNQIRLQMHVVVQLDATRVFPAITHNRKLRMPMIEACNPRHIRRLPSSSFQV
jgi:hypothetical protein